MRTLIIILLTLITLPSTACSCDSVEHYAQKIDGKIVLLAVRSHTIKEIDLTNTDEVADIDSAILQKLESLLDGQETFLSEQEIETLNHRNDTGDNIILLAACIIIISFIRLISG